MKKLHVATKGWIKKECEVEIQGTGDESRAFCFVNDAIDQIMIIFEKVKTGDFPFAYKIFSESLDIPIWVGLSKEKQDYIIETISLLVIRKK